MKGFDVHCFEAELSTENKISFYVVRARRASATSISWRHSLLLINVTLWVVIQFLERVRGDPSSFSARQVIRVFLGNLMPIVGRAMSDIRTYMLSPVLALAIVHRCVALVKLISPSSMLPDEKRGHKYAYELFPVNTYLKCTQ